MRVCILSNGYGEDRAAATIAAEIKRKYPRIEVWGAPMITEGAEYAKRGIPVIAGGEVPPSGGFTLKSLRGFLLDLLFFHRHFHYYRKLKASRNDFDSVLVVGDFMLMMTAWFALRRRPVFFNIAKSCWKDPHYGIEEYFMRRIPAKVVTRDSYTEEQLGSKGIDTVYLGNPMMDGLSPRGIDLGSGPIVGILPGSRLEAYPNLRVILQVVELVKEDANYVCALPSSLSPDAFAREAEKDGWSLENDILSKGNKRVRLLPDSFEDVIARSGVIIGLAGTANEQAAGMGVPVVSLTGNGPQTTAGRMAAQERLLGGAVRFARSIPDAAADVNLLLADENERKRRGDIGKKRMGTPGASEAIADFIASYEASTP